MVIYEPHGFNGDLKFAKASLLLVLIGGFEVRVGLSF